MLENLSVSQIRSHNPGFIFHCQPLFCQVHQRRSDCGEFWNEPLEGLQESQKSPDVRSRPRLWPHLQYFKLIEILCQSFLSNKEPKEVNLFIHELTLLR